MAATTSWDIIGLDCDQNGTVKAVHYRLSAADEEKEAFKTVTGSVDLDPPGVPFIAWESLDKDLVLSWVKTKLGSEFSKMEEDIVSQLSNIKESLPSFPW